MNYETGSTRAPACIARRPRRVALPRPFFVLFMPATEKPRVLRVLSGYRHPVGHRAGQAGRAVLPVLPLRFLRVLMFKSNQIIPKGH